MRFVTAFIFSVLLVGTAVESLAENDPPLELRNAILEIENHAHDTPRKDSVTRLLALLDRFSLPSQREDILCAVGLLFHQRYNHDLEKADYGQAAEYFRQAIAVRDSYREAMLNARLWLLESYEELQDRERFDECLGDLLYLDPEWILRDEYDAAFLRNYLAASYRGGGPIPESSLTFKEIRWEKMRRLRKDVRENYERNIKPFAVRCAVMVRLRSDGIEQVRNWLEQCRALDDTVAVSVLEKWLAEREPKK